MLACFGCLSTLCASLRNKGRGSRLLHRLDDLDLLFEEFIYQLGQFHAFRIGLLRQVGLHFLIEIYRELKDGVRPVKLPTLAFGKVILVFIVTPLPLLLVTIQPTPLMFSRE